MVVGGGGGGGRRGSGEEVRVFTEQWFWRWWLKWLKRGEKQNVTLFSEVTPLAAKIGHSEEERAGRGGGGINETKLITLLLGLFH